MKIEVTHSVEIQQTRSITVLRVESDYLGDYDFAEYADKLLQVARGEYEPSENSEQSASEEEPVKGAERCIPTSLDQLGIPLALIHELAALAQKPGTPTLRECLEDLVQAIPVWKAGIRIGPTNIEAMIPCLAMGMAAKLTAEQCHTLHTYIRGCEQRIKELEAQYNLVGISR